MAGMILAAFAEALTAAVRRAILRQQLRLAALAIALLALAFFAVAWDLWLATRLGHAGAAAVTGAMLALTALAILLVAGTLRQPWNLPSLGAAATPEALGAEFNGLAQPLTIVALILGFLLARTTPRDGTGKE
jgi:hypothetical protein